MAYEDEITAANRLPTREARLAARNAVRAKYGMASEEKKRGGLAGFYDRNKQLIQAGLPTLAGMFIPGGGALAGAITGGLARGLDRPGQGGVALNLGQAARGAATGATLGSLGEKFSPFKPSMGAPAPAPTPAPTPASTGTGSGGGMPLNVLRERQETQAIGILPERNRRRCQPLCQQPQPLPLLPPPLRG